MSAPIIQAESAPKRMKAAHGRGIEDHQDDWEHDEAEGGNDPYQMALVENSAAVNRKMTYVGGETGSKEIVPERPVFETLD